MKMIDTQPQPPLAPPGAGLPQPELTIAKLMFAWARATRTREKITGLFQQERSRIRSLVQGCSEEKGSCRVLIKRLPGMEDSSRFWSIWMTLDHLCLVHQGIANTIRDLGNGSAPKGAASTAAVKPHLDADGSALQKFEQSCELVLHRAAELPDLKTTARYDHPWFGPLTALGWYGIAPFHLKLHRVQIEQILALSRGT